MVMAKCQLHPEIETVYRRPDFTFEVRHYLAEWIEEQPWSRIDVDNPDHATIAVELYQELIRQLEAKIHELTDDLICSKFRLQEAAKSIKDKYEANPLEFVRLVQQCLAMEATLIEQSKKNTDHSSDSSSDSSSDVQPKKNHIAIKRALLELEKWTQKTASDLKSIQLEKQAYIIQWQESVTMHGQLEQLQQQPNRSPEVNENEIRKYTETVDTLISLTAKSLVDNRMLMAQAYQETITGLQKLQTHVLDTELINWKRQQQFAGNGGPMDEGLEVLQNWCEMLADIIWMNLQQINEVNLLFDQLPINLVSGTQNTVTDLFHSISDLLSSLVKRTFIVETQPRQVLKKEILFEAKVRLLFGGKLNVHMNPPQVKATIISEQQAKDILISDVTAKDETCGTILNNVATMEYTNGQLGITIRNMKLKNIQRANRRGTVAVTEEKFCILFQSKFSLCGKEYNFQVWTLSLPIVVIVHGNQECNALATIFWDNAFSQPTRSPFEVPDSVPWLLLAEQLNTKFKSAVGQGLTEDNMKYLASKLIMTGDDPNNLSVTWASFNKNALSKRAFTFWEWFYSIIKLSRDQLKTYWNDGSIIGFIGKLQAKECLLSKPFGTFILRFSDFNIGGITIAYVANKSGIPEVENLAPFVTKDFTILSLPARIKGFGQLVFLYPDIPKADVFSKYCASTEIQTVNKDGYAPTELVNVIPQGIGAPMNSPTSPPAIPSSFNSLMEDLFSMDDTPGDIDMTDIMVF